MTCRGTSGDYLCQGWRNMAAQVLDRDGSRCRGCNRTKDDARLEVHHRAYGAPGPCGKCVLTGVSLDDLTTLCADCHEAITNVRRRLRYGGQTVEVSFVPDPTPAQVAVRVRTEITVDHVVEPIAPVVVVRRSVYRSLNKD